MAKVVVALTEDWRKISELAGGDPSLIMFDPPPSELECPDVTQAALDTAHAAYLADQTNIDAATQAAKDAVLQEGDKEWYDTRRLHRAIVELLIDEINLLRQQFNATTTELNAIDPSVTVTTFNDRTIAQARSAIRTKIDNL